MNSFKSNRSFLPTHSLAFAFALTTLAFAAFGCDTDSISVDNLKVVPDTANKGETLLVEGNIDTIGTIESLKVTVVDDKGATPPGITVKNNALSNKSPWDLRKDGDVKVETTPDAPSGKYRVRVESKTEEKSDTEEVSFTVR